MSNRKPEKVRTGPLVPLTADEVALQEAQANELGLVPLEALYDAQAGYGPRDQLGSNEYEDPEWAEAFANQLYVEDYE